MSLFPELQEAASVYHPDESSGKVTYPATADFTTNLVIQDMTAEDRMIFGDSLGTFYTYTSESRIVRGDKIVSGGKTYFVTDVPAQVKLFSEFKIFLKAEKL